ncbi:MAG: ribonuclease III [Calditrichaeota bacterium]|nr:ribonuclease III [Calditrichota bacterium]MCB9366491.1 ribonuclease III [Calditrichota bacterium]MCB9391251.1 ribonuclease III [Calditrichota bacterium]
MSFLRQLLRRNDGGVPSELRQQLRRLEKRIGYRFTDSILLVSALRHRSVLNKENLGRHESNERLEFLGDAVLDFIIAEYFYHLFPGMVEGQLTKLRSVIVSGTALVEAARRIDLGSHLILSENEDRAGGRNRASILEDAFEALIGAIYLDRGIAPAREFVETHLLDNWREVVKKDEYVNFKSLVLEHAQANSWDSPEYRLVEETGPDHSKRFVVEIFLNGESFGRGDGSSKKSAEQKAASVAASKLGLLGSDDLDSDSASG